MLVSTCVDSLDLLMGPSLFCYMLFMVLCASPSLLPGPVIWRRWCSPPIHSQLLSLSSLVKSQRLTQASCMGIWTMGAQDAGQVAKSSQSGALKLSSSPIPDAWLGWEWHLPWDPHESLSYAKFLAWLLCLDEACSNTLTRGHRCWQLSLLLSQINKIFKKKEVKIKNILPFTLLPKWNT